jgi:hypothetical protein
MNVSGSDSDNEWMVATPQCGFATWLKILHSTKKTNTKKKKKAHFAQLDEMFDPFRHIHVFLVAMAELRG